MSLSDRVVASFAGAADAPEFGLGADISAGAPGSPCHIEGSVRNTAGEPVADAVLDIWQSDGEGGYVLAPE